MCMSLHPHYQELPNCNCRTTFLDLNLEAFFQTWLSNPRGTLAILYVIYKLCDIIDRSRPDFANLLISSFTHYFSSNIAYLADIYYPICKKYINNMATSKMKSSVIPASWRAQFCVVDSIFLALSPLPTKLLMRSLAF